MKNRQSKHNQVKAHLESGRNITGLEALHLYGLYNLNTVIYRLRNKGMKIHIQMITDEKGNSFGQYNQIID